MDLLPQSYATQGFVASKVVQTKEKNHHDQHPINQFFFLAIEVFGCLDKQANVFRLCQCHLELQRAKGPSFFYFSDIFLSKIFNYIVKVASILHLKLGGNGKPSYFLTSTPSKCTPHHHG
jgi:hypothetical protein